MRGGEPLPEITGRMVILVDGGRKEGIVPAVGEGRAD